jgi:hypothetical protein
VCLQATINHLYKAHDACDATEASPEQYVDQAWVLWYGAGKGPIALGEKRCIQFGTCTDNDADTFSGGCVGPSDDLDCGDSTVNSNILASFLRTQTAAKEADCDTILTEIEDVIVPQAFVPVMQGLFREAWYERPTPALLVRSLACWSKQLSKSLTIPNRQNSAA